MRPTAAAPPTPAVAGGYRWYVGILVVGYVVMFAWVLPSGSSETVTNIALTPLVVLGGGVLSLRLARGQSDRWIGRVIVVGYVLKLLASAAFYLLVFHGPGGDAGRYHEVGADVARSVWGGEFFALGARGWGGTATMETLAGLLYTVTTPAPAVGFATFATLSFVGSYLFYRAFVLMVPGAHLRLYAALVFILPSMLFWPSSLGKEAWMILMLGLATYGASRLLAGRRGVLMLLAGVAGIGILRPHMAALTVAALAAAPLVPRNYDLSRRQRRGRWALLLVVLVAGGVATIAAQRTFGLGSVSAATVVGFLEVVAENTGTGGSEFSNVETINPLLSPLALASVLLRPLPHEAANATMLLASLESIFVAALLVLRWRSIAAALRSAFRDPFVTYALLYTVLFALSYSFFNNLGLLARERVQLLPILFVLLAVPYGRPRTAPPSAASPTLTTETAKA